MKKRGLVMMSVLLVILSGCTVSNDAKESVDFSEFKPMPADDLKIIKVEESVN